MEQKRRSAIRNERGVALAYVGIGFLVLTGLAAVAIDTAHVALVANEVQIAADAAATSGALRMLTRPPGTAADQLANAGAQEALAENHIDGENAGGAAVTVHTRFLPNPDCPVGPLRIGPGLDSFNGVTAEITAMVPSLLGPLVGAGGATPITRSATAIVRGSMQTPDFPIAPGDCSGFVSNCFMGSCLPNVIEIPRSSTAWTAFDNNASDPHNVVAFFPEECGGRDTEVPEFELYDRISLKNDFDPVQHTVILNAVECMLNRNLIHLNETRFTVPVVSCSARSNDSSEIVGFATVVVSGFDPGKGITVRPVIDSGKPGSPTPCFFSGGYVELLG